MVTTPNDRIDTLINKMGENHLEVVQRLTRMETQMSGLPARVARLERRNNQLSGALGLLSALWLLLLKVFH